MSEILKSGTFRRAVALLLGVVVIALNKKLNLGLGVEELAVIGTMISTYVLGSNYKEAKIDGGAESSPPIIDLKAAAAELTKKDG